MCAFQKEGLQVLILDKNQKFSDVGLRQLIRILKGDSWLKILCLRCCGITDRGGQLILELLQINLVLRQIDLRENEIRSDILQVIRKSLKREKSKEERISIKKQLPRYKHSSFSQLTSNKFPKNQVVRLTLNSFKFIVI